MYEKYVKEAHTAIKEQRLEEESKIDEQIIQKVLIFSELISSETLILLPNEMQQIKSLNQTDTGESL